jgi:hypothetical protein
VVESDQPVWADAVVQVRGRKKGGREREREKRKEERKKEKEKRKRKNGKRKRKEIGKEIGKSFRKLGEFVGKLGERILRGFPVFRESARFSGRRGWRGGSAGRTAACTGFPTW